MRSKNLPSKEWLTEQHLDKFREAKDIAKELGVSPGTMSEYFKKLGIPVKRWKSRVKYNTSTNKKLNDRQWLIQKHINERISITDLAEELDVNYNTLLYIFKKHKIKPKIYNEQQSVSFETIKKLNDCEWLIHQNHINHHSCEEIARQLGDVCSATVKKYFKKYKIKVKIFHDEALKRNIETCNLKYGVAHPTQKHMGSDTIQKINDKEWLIYQHNILKKSASEIAKELSITDHTVWKRFDEFEIKLTRFPVSTSEKEIIDFINTLTKTTIQTNTRNIISPKELDIYLPEYNTAIEFDGIFWHSYDKQETTDQRLYHLDKTQRCKEKNITLFHIFENEWLDPNKQDIWKSIISRAICFPGRRIFARKCKIEIVNVADKKKFVNDNHLQGDVPSSTNIGLYYNNELVSVMTFGRPRFNNKYSWEILRYCTKKYTSIIGGASKIWKYFLNNYEGSIISYCDIRYSTGNIYKLLGFKYLHHSKPNYYYTTAKTNKNGQILLESRVKYQKHKLARLLPEFNPTLIESQNMFNNGYRRIWDCGNLVFSFDR
jgi:AraC-like DNA-binding protein